MQFLKSGEWHKVVRISGPSHNLLGISFVNGAAPLLPIVEALPSNEGLRAELTPEEIRIHVLSGVAEANARLGVSYVVGKIQFIPTDSRPPDVYQFLAKTIVERLVRGEAFNEVTLPGP